MQYLRRRDHAERHHNSIRIFLTNFGYKQRSHSSSCSTTERMSQLKSLQTVATFGLFPDDVEDRVDEFSAFGVVAFGPIVPGAALPENEIVRPKYLAERAGAYRVHCPRLQVDQDRSWNVLPSRRFVVINVYAFQLEIGVTVVGAGWIYTVLVGDHLPKLCVARGERGREREEKNKMRIRRRKGKR